MSTPVQRQYNQLKSENPDAVLFFQLGDFYEMFHEDAVLASRVLGITLTARHRGTENEMPMCGFPIHAHKDYLEKFVAAGYKIAVADQFEEPETKKIDRKITRVITPGTNMHPDSAEKNSFLAAVLRDKNHFGLAYADLSTGDFRTAFFEEEKSFLDELFKISPQEILLPTELFEDQAFCEKLKLFHLTLRKKGNEKESANALQKHFGVSDLSVFGIEKLKILIEVSAMALQYLEETQKTDLSHITKLVQYSTAEIMTLDAQTLQHLEIFTPLRQTENTATLYSVFAKPYTAMGGRKMRTWIANPLLSMEKINARLNAVQELTENLALTEELTEKFRQIFDLERILARLVTNRGNARDLAFFRDSLINFTPLQILCKNTSNQLINEKSELFGGFEAITKKLALALADNPPLEITEGKMFRDGFNPKLDEFRSLTNDSELWLGEFLEARKKESGIQNLKIKYSKNFGFCMEVSAGQKDNVPENWIRRQTLVNAERFTTPELSEYEERALSAQSQACALEHEMFHALRTELCQYTEKIQLAAKAIAELDTLLAFTRTAEKWRWNKPEVNENQTDFVVEQGRHPVVEQLTDENFIVNDLKMGSESHFHLITGPNMAGKSTFLRQNALIILLAQIGSFVPAKQVQMGIFDRIFTRVGASDNLAGGQSTYFVEMMETATILNAATEKSFVILDEIGRGTSTFDGISIAWAITEFLHEKIKAKTLFATHYHELIDLAENLSHAKNFHISVAQNKAGITFLRKICSGGISDSFGIDVAASAGLPKELIANAREILQRLESENLIERPNLFSAPRVREKIVEINKETEVENFLSNLDPNEMSPKEALEALFQMKEKQQNKS